jgi:tryptophan synthase alpha chain
VNRIDRAFERARAENRAALIVFITAGDPDLDTTRELVPVLAEAGADIVELGIPHSDPIAEGPTIQAASARALEHGTSLVQVLGVCQDLRVRTQVPIVLMGYLNNVLAYGTERFAQDAATTGVDGLIITDAPHEEGAEFQAACEANGVHRILLVAPTSTPSRVVEIASRSRGFVYCVSVTGVTGVRERLPSDLESLVRRIGRVTATPVAVGFGISTPELAGAVARMADGVIVGSALVQRIAESGSRTEAIDNARDFVADLSRAVREVKR